ncbi:retrotransposon ORF1 [Tanacetum coccineum]
MLDRDQPSQPIPLENDNNPLSFAYTTTTTVRYSAKGVVKLRVESEDPNQHLKDFLKLVDSLDLDGENRERTRLRLFQFSLRDQASNWLERLPAGSITTWEDLTTRFLAQFFPLGRTAKLRNDIMMFQQHHGESLSEAWTRIDYAAGGRLRKLRQDEAWATIERLAQYEDEGWNDTLTPDEVSLNFKNPDIEQLLGIMERKVDALMTDAISLMGKSESVFRFTTNKIYRPPSELSRQEEFEHIVTNFILDQEERITQLKNYKQVIVEEFMEFSSEVTRRLKERIKENENKPRKIKKITKYPDTKVLENSAKCHVTNYEHKTMHVSLSMKEGCRVQFLIEDKAADGCHLWSNVSLSQTLSRAIVTLEYKKARNRKYSTWFQLFGHEGRVLILLSIAVTNGRKAAMSKRARSTRGQASSSHNETMEEKVRKYDPLHKGVTFRLGGVEKEMSLLEFRWRVGLYSEGESRNVATLSGLRKAETVNSTRETHLIWPSIGDGMFNVGNIKAQSIRNPRIKLAHRCIIITITGRKETTNRVTEIDLFYLYCIFGEGVVCNIPYWLAKYLKGVRDKAMIFRGMFVTKIARSFGLLTDELVSVLNCEPPPHVYRKKSLVKMRVIMELHEGVCCWPATRGIMEENEGDDEEGDEEGGNKGVGGSADVYRNISAGEWQVHQAQWMGQQDDR